MKTVVLLLALSIFHRGEGCLKVRMVAPPKCECQARGLDGTNIAQQVTDPELLNNLTSYPLRSPIIGVDDCSGVVYCEDGYSLFIVDSDKTTNFDKYAAEGICDPFTQTWQVDDGEQDYGFSTYQRLYGTCVNFNPTCDCTAAPLNASDVETLMDIPEATAILKDKEWKPPIINENGCNVEFLCEDDYNLYVWNGVMNAFGKYAAEGICDPFTQTWQVDDGGQDYGFSSYSAMYGICVAESDPNPPTGKCGCPAIGIIDQAGIQQDEYNYLGNRRTVEAKITVSDSCEVTVDATASGDGDFHLFIYRSPFPPIMMKRFLPSTLSAQRVFKLDIQCASVNGVYQWQFEGSKISSDPMNLALVENEDACECSEIMTHSLGGYGSRSYSNGTCDLQRVSCNEASQAFLMSSTFQFPDYDYDTYTMLLIGREFDVSSATCVDGTKWVYNNYALNYPAFFCTEYERDIGYPEFEEPCKCRKLNQLYLVPGDQWDDMRNQADYDPERVLVGKTSTVGSMDLDNDSCSVKLQCPQGDELVLLGRGMKPKFYPPGTILTSKCVHSPMSEMEYVWWTEEYMVTDVSFTCITPSDTNPPTGECGCPAIGTIDQARIRLEEYNYLGNRSTVNAKITVSSSCEVTVDATASGDGDFHLFIYRSPFPPIMMKRLLPSTPSAQRIFKLDIQCASVDGVYQWQYEGSKISSEAMDLALIENEDACQCEPIGIFGGGDKPRSYLNGTCDLERWTCNENEYFWIHNHHFLPGMSITFYPVERYATDSDIASVTCVDGDKWFYNNLEMVKPRLDCGNGSGDPFEKKCKCVKFYPAIFSPIYVEENLFQFDPERVYIHKNSTVGSMEYDIDSCSVNLQCPQGHEIVLLGRAMKPATYPPGTVLTSRCVHSPMSELEYVWWTNEYMVTTATFACFKIE